MTEALTALCNTEMEYMIKQISNLSGDSIKEFRDNENILFKCDSIPDLYGKIDEAKAKDKHFDDKLEKGESYIQAKATLFKWTPMFTGDFDYIEEQWNNIIGRLKSKIPDNSFDAAREFYSCTLCQWGFSAAYPAPANGKNGYLGLGSYDEMNAILLATDDWSKLMEIFGEKLVIDVELIARLKTIEYKFHDFKYGGINIHLQPPEYELQIDDPSKIRKTFASRYFGAYVWQEVESTDTNIPGFAVWEHCNVASLPMFEYCKKKVLERAHELMDNREFYKLGQNSWDAKSRQL